MMKPKPALKDQFAQAKALIQRKQYTKARALLRKIDHPTAQEWLAKLEVIAPEKNYQSGASRRLAMIVIALLAVFGALMALSQALDNFSRTVGSAMQMADQELGPMISGSTPTSVAVAATDTPPTDASIPTITEVAAPIAVIETVTPSATLTDTLTPTQAPPTPTPAPTDAPPETWYTQRTANLRTCASTTCDQVVQLESGAPINIIGFEYGENYKGSDIWRIVDYNGQRVYVHSSLIAANPPLPTSAPIQVVYPTSAPIVQPPVNNPGLVCPKNCAEAVALGWTAQQAGQCSNLDRDGDGVACYGD